MTEGNKGHESKGNKFAEKKCYVLFFLIHKHISKTFNNNFIMLFYKTDSITTHCINKPADICRLWSSMELFGTLNCFMTYLVFPSVAGRAAVLYNKKSSDKPNVIINR